MFDFYCILSGGINSFHQFNTTEDWIIQNGKPSTGTTIYMKLNNHTTRADKQIFDEYMNNDDLTFNKTVIPVKLAQYGNDELISRSQAKRLLARVDLFKIVVFDFTGVTSIGRAFADEIFRVYFTGHPEIKFLVIHENDAIKKIINSAKANSRNVFLDTPLGNTEGDSKKSG